MLAASKRGRATLLSGEAHAAVADISRQSMLARVLGGRVARPSPVVALHGYRAPPDRADHDHLGRSAAV